MPSSGNPKADPVPSRPGDACGSLGFRAGVVGCPSNRHGVARGLSRIVVSPYISGVVLLLGALMNETEVVS